MIDLKATHPPAIAGGTDLFQAGCFTHPLPRVFVDTTEDFYAMVLGPSNKKRADLCSHTKSTLGFSTLKRKVKSMVTHSSATARQQTSHVNRTTRTATIMNALKQRAQAVLNNQSLDDQSRAILRHALETNDPWLAELVRRAPDADEDDSSRGKIEALAEIICQAGAQSTAALFVLMGMLQNSTDAKALANTAKHFAF